MEERAARGNRAHALEAGLLLSCAACLAWALVSIWRADLWALGFHRAALREIRLALRWSIPVGLLLGVALPLAWRGAGLATRRLARRRAADWRAWRARACLCALILAAGLFLGLRHVELKRWLQFTDFGLWLARFERPVHLAVASGVGLAGLAALALLYRALRSARLGDFFLHRRWRGIASRGALAIGLSVWMGAELWPALNPGRATGPNVVLITIDTLRADHLGCYGYPRDVSSNLDRLAAEGLLFTGAWAQAPWTLPSMASLHTTLYPSQHGAVDSRRRIAEHLPTLAEVMQEQGYQTLGVVGHLFVGEKHGFAQGFDFFDQSNFIGHNAVTSKELTEFAVETVRARLAEPYFLWVHYFDPHWTFVAHEGYDYSDSYQGPLPDQISWADLKDGTAGFSAADVQYVRDLYDEEIAYTDFWIGQLVERLRALPGQRETLTVVTADHGEEFMERGTIGHGHKLYQELLHVPLILHGAIPEDLRGASSGAAVELSQVAPTILELCGIDHPFAAASLLSAAQNPDSAAAVYSEGSYAARGDNNKRALRLGDWKLIYNGEHYELYDLARDPRESTDLFETSGEPEVEQLRDVLVGKLSQIMSAMGQEQAPTLDLGATEVDHLRELGYLER